MPKGKPSRYCKFSGCQNTSESAGIHLYRFPKDEQRCQAWVKASQNTKLHGIPATKLYNNAYLCHTHFHDWCFMNVSTKHSLVHNACPSCAKPQQSPISDERNISLASETSTVQHSSLLQQLLVSPPNSSSSHVSTVSLPSDMMDCSDPSAATNVLDPINYNTPVSSNRYSKWESKLAATSTPNSPVSRKYTPRKVKLARKLKKSRDSTRQLKSRFAAFKRKYKCSTSQSLKATLTSYGVGDTSSSFLQRQVKLSVTKAKSRRYTEFDKIHAYRIFSKSKAAYRVLRQLLQLPSERTLQRFISSKLTKPGLNVDVLEALKKILEGKTLREKLFALVIDEMSLKPCLVYDKEKDEVVGFEDFSEGVRSNNVANQALVVMLRSLTSKKKLPLGFYFSKHAMPASKLKKIVIDTIASLFHAGATVKALICDQGVNNSAMLSQLGVDPKNPFFMLNGEKVFCIYDPPHLLKNLRRNLMKYDLQTNNGLVSYKHIRDFYTVDQQLLIRCAPKLTDKHVYSTGLNSMKVSLAAQVFSHSVAAGMNMCHMAGRIDARAYKTVEFIQNMNYLFDSVNGTRKIPVRGKKFHCAVKEDSEHRKFWEQMIEFIQSWVFVLPQDQATGKKQCHGPRCKTGWTLTLTALSLLSEEMLSIMEYFMTKRCNQDCLENFFSRIRGSGGNRNNPSAYEFCSAYRLSCFNTVGSHSKFSNCEPDGDRFMFLLLSSGSQVVENETTAADETSDHTLTIDTCDSDDEALQCTSMEVLDVIQRNTVAYLGGHLARKVLRALHLNCDLCVTLLTDKTKPMTQHTLYIYFKEYENNTGYGLTYPSHNMLKCTAAILESSETYFSHSLASENVLKNLKAYICQSPMLNFINCAEHAENVKDKLVCFSAALFMKIHLREKNRQIAKSTTDLKNLRNPKKKK